MTGFGKAKCELTNKTINIELRSLNSKQLDIMSKIPAVYKEKEAEIRSYIAKNLERGKIDISMSIDTSGETSKLSLNRKLARQYYDELISLSKELNHNQNTDYLSILMRMPEVLSPEKDELNEDEWGIIKLSFNEAIAELDTFRIQEGTALEEDFLKRTALILNLLSQIEPYEKARIDVIRSRIEKDMKQFIDDTQFDKNRFEQELLYYIEKLDITEEKIRLKKHCDYFVETVNEDQSSGKKLSFISQEMGREINTLGSKANDVNIQKIVVRMKDELEKIKEQLSNVL